MSSNVPKNSYQDLARLYREVGDGSGLGILRRPPSSRWRRLTMVFFFLLLAASVAAWLGLSYWQPLSPSGSSVGLTIAGPETSAAATVVTYRVVVANTSAGSLEEANLRLNYPEGFVWQSATLSPDTEAHTTWNLQAFGAGERKQIDISGILLGESGSIKTIFGVVTYRLPNFRSELEASTSMPTKLTDPPVQLVWSGPQHSAPGASATYTLTYDYAGSMPLPSSAVRLALPVTFTVVATDPALPANQDYQWKLSGLPPSATGTLNLTGTWSKDATGDQVLQARVEVLGDTKAMYPVTRQSFTTRVVTGDVVLNLTVNGQVAPPAASLGDTLNYDLAYQNGGDKPIEEVEVRVRYESSFIDWGKVSLNGARLDGTTLVWTSTSTPALASILPGASGSLHWTITLVSTSPKSGLPLTITSVPSLEHRRVAGEVADRSYDGPTVVVLVNGSVQVQAEARYFNDRGTAVGSGSLPPRVGSPTSYQIMWRGQNSEHPPSKVKIKATLPSNVTTGGATTADVGQADFSNVHQPKWNIDTIAPGLEPALVFRVTFKPKSDDVGKIIALSLPLQLTATDAVTGGSLSVGGNAVTTNLATDATGSGQGVVVP